MKGCIKKMKVLITGGAGFIGSHLADQLVMDEHEVILLDNLSTGNKQNISHLMNNSKVKFVEGSVLDEGLMDKLASEADQIYHLAAAVGVKYILDNPIDSIQTNVKGTEIALKLADKYQRKILIASTSEVYGKQNKILKETDDRIYGNTYTQRWSYSAAKAMDEFLSLAYHAERNLPVVVVRFFNTVGPRQTGRYGMVIPNFVTQALNNDPITIYGTGKQTRSFTHIADVVSAITRLMNTEKSAGEIYNVGNGKTIAIEDLAKLVKEKTSSKSDIVYLSYEEAYGSSYEDMQERTPDITKITRHIGYKPAYNLDRILEDVISYYKEKNREERTAAI